MHNLAFSVYCDLILFQILNLNGYSKDESLTIKPIIRQNVIESFNMIIVAMDNLKIQLAEDENRAAVERFQELSAIHGSKSEKHTLRELRELTHLLLNDRGFLDCFGRSHEFYLPDSAEYFIGRVGAFLYFCMFQSRSKNWSNILQYRERTTI